MDNQRIIKPTLVFDLILSDLLVFKLGPNSTFTVPKAFLNWERAYRICKNGLPHIYDKPQLPSFTGKGF
jgi:hypothetical protein